MDGEMTPGMAWCWRTRGSEAGSLRHGWHRGHRRAGRDRYLYRAAAAGAAHRPGVKGSCQLVVNLDKGGVPRLRRPLGAGRRPEAGAGPRRLAGSGLHPTADPEDPADHRADGGLRHLRDRGPGHRGREGPPVRNAGLAEVDAETASDQADAERFPEWFGSQRAWPTSRAYA